MPDKPPERGLSTVVASKEDRKLLDKAQEIVDLFRDAIRLGYSITFSPEQMQLLIAICEEGHLIKAKREK